MIRDLSESLKAILDDPKLPEPLNSAEIVFDRPDDKFNPQKNTVNLFLYDIRENVELRSNEPRIERKDRQAIIYPPPVRITCSYLITAWPFSVTDLPLEEHRLLSQILSVLSKYPTIPDKFLQGSLKGQKPPLPMITAQTEGFKNPAEFWTAIGNKMRPSLTVAVIISLEICPPENAPIVITEEIRLGQRILSGEEKISSETKEELFHINGRITSNKEPKENLTVTLVELGIKTQTDVDGRYVLGSMNSGNYTLFVQSDNTVLKESIITVPASKETANKNYDVEY